MAQKPITREEIAELLDLLATSQFIKARETVETSHLDPIVYFNLQSMDIRHQSDLRWLGARTLRWIDQYESDRGRWRTGQLISHHYDYF